MKQANIRMTWPVRVWRAAAIEVLLSRIKSGLETPLDLYIINIIIIIIIIIIVIIIGKINTIRQMININI